MCRSWYSQKKAIGESVAKQSNKRSSETKIAEIDAALASKSGLSFGVCNFLKNGGKITEQLLNQ
jgi:hypothetical protein